VRVSFTREPLIAALSIDEHSSAGSIPPNTLPYETPRSEELHRPSFLLSARSLFFHNHTKFPFIHSILGPLSPLGTPPTMFHYRTEGFNGYSVKYSPFYDNRLATAASANFGLVGNGRLYILSLTPSGILCERYYDTQDSLFDVAFSESHENQVAVASGDGSIKLFDTTLEGGFPIANWGEHKKEVFCLSWNLVDKGGFVSSSWDGNVKLVCFLLPSA